MIRALKRKFICINMLLIALVLLIVFSIFVWAAYRRVQTSNTRTLERVADRERNAGIPLFEIGLDPNNRMEDGMRPPNMEYKAAFLVFLAEDGSFTPSVPADISISDELLAAAVAQAADADSDTGLLYSLSLRYLKKTDQAGARIAFVDVSGDIATLKNTLLTLALVGVLALGAFLLISLFLAGWALRPAARAWEQQRQFVADASHELKTPLTVVLANTDILLTHGEDTIASRRKWLDSTRVECLHMKALVEDMLALARADADRKAIQEPVNLSDLLNGCLLSFEPVAFERGVTLEPEVEDAVTVTGDAAQLQRVFCILLDNAIKYAYAGSAVRLSLRRVSDRTVFCIHNRSEGISQSDLPHIFERFYRADKARGSQDGYGLGLAIAKAVVQAHHGGIRADSTDRDGTTFTVTLP